MIQVLNLEHIYTTLPNTFFIYNYANNEIMHANMRKTGVSVIWL